MSPSMKMPRRRFLIGSGLAALSACAGRTPGVTHDMPGPDTPVPTGTAARWPPFPDGITIDGASALEIT